MFAHLHVQSIYYLPPHTHVYVYIYTHIYSHMLRENENIYLNLQLHTFYDQQAILQSE